MLQSEVNQCDKYPIGLIPDACSIGLSFKYPCRNYPAGDERRETEQLEHLIPCMEAFIARYLYGCRAGGLRQN
jgi:hypothetical protein